MSRFLSSSVLPLQRTRALFWITCLWLCCSTLVAASLPASNPTLDHWVRSTLDTLDPEARLAYPELVALTYRQAAFQNFWHDRQGQPTSAAHALSYELQPWLALGEDHPKLRRYQELDQLLIQPIHDIRPRQRQAIDLLITDLFFRFQQDLLARYWTTYDQDQDHGITNPYERWDQFPDEVVPTDLVSVFPEWLRALNSGNLQRWVEARLASTRPVAHFYQPWRQAFDQLNALADQTWPQLDVDLAPEQAHAQVRLLAEQLIALRDLSADYQPQLVAPAQPATLQLAESEPPPSSDFSELSISAETQQATPGSEPQIAVAEAIYLFDATLVSGLRRFQQRHALPVTGRVDEATRAALNRHPAERSRILAHNLRRLHHLPQELQARHLMVNLADQQLELIEHGERTLAMRIIIGRDGQRTPIMNQWLTSLVLNPLWNVPNSIAKDRIFPRARSNPEYLASRDYALVQGWHTPARFVNIEDLPDDAFTSGNQQYRIVQKPGRFNQLGRAKFRLSNQQAIYLHDTPYRQFFSQTQRDISAGCIRLEESARLVDALLAPSRHWTPERISETYASGDERYIRVFPRVAVYLMYWTAWVDAEGQIQWREDIYHKDQLGYSPAIQQLANPSDPPASPNPARS